MEKHTAVPYRDAPVDRIERVPRRCDDLLSTDTTPLHLWRTKVHANHLYVTFVCSRLLSCFQLHQHITHLLGNVQSDKKVGHIAIGTLPWQTASSHDQIWIDQLVFTAAKKWVRLDSRHKWCSVLLERYRNRVGSTSGCYYYSFLNRWKHIEQYRDRKIPPHIIIHHET
jgi:hypothetical protein